MIHAVEDRNVRNVERIDALKAAHIVGILLRIRAPLMVGMDAAHTAEIMLRSPGVELVELQAIVTLHDAQCRQWTMAPLRRQMEQLQRCASTIPSGKVSSSTTAPQ